MINRAHNIESQRNSFNTSPHLKALKLTGKGFTLNIVSRLSFIFMEGCQNNSISLLENTAV